MTDHPFIPYGASWLDEDDIQAVVDVLRGDWLTTGPHVEEFETALKASCDAKHAVAVSSGTAALHAAYAAAGLDAGDEIITSPLTFAATADAARYLGASVRFVDVSPDTGNLDPAAVREAIGPKTKLIVPVDFGGHPADYDALRGIANAHDLLLVADASHSLGGSYNGQPVGTVADLTTVSLHPIKPVTTGEGGAVLTNGHEWAERARVFRNHGIVRDRSVMRRADEGAWYTEMHMLGFNYRLTDFQCALGTSQLKKLSPFIERRRLIANRYTEAFADLDGIELPILRPGSTSGWHLYPIRVRGSETVKRALFDHMRSVGLGVQVHYLPVYLHPYYADLGYPEGLCPIAEDIYRRSLTLPVFPKMTDDNIDSVIERTRSAVKTIVG